MSVTHYSCITEGSPPNFRTDRNEAEAGERHSLSLSSPPKNVSWDAA